MNDLEIFTGARHQDTLEQRQAFITSACDGDSGRRRRLEQMLLLSAETVSLLDSEPLSLLQNLGAHLNSGSGDERPDLSRLVLQQLEPTSDDTLGQIGHFQVQSVLGQGGFGVVLKATDTKLLRDVAIKVLSPTLAVDSAHRARFLHEARSVAAIRHENVVQIYSVEERPFPYIVMELVDAKTLGQCLSRHERMPLSDVIRVAMQIASGLDAAHAKGIIHRDIKPANILLESDSERRVVITDFGLAFSTTDEPVLQSDQLIGTPAYMSPEQIVGDEVDHRTDLFSLGGVLYTMCCGKQPFDAPSTSALLRAVTHDAIVPLSQRLSIASPPLAMIIERLLSKVPEHRPQSARDVIDDLQKCSSNPSGRRLGAKSLLVVAAVATMLAIGIYAGVFSPNSSTNGDGISAIDITKPQEPAAPTTTPASDSVALAPKHSIAETGEEAKQTVDEPPMNFVGQENSDHLSTPWNAQELVDHVIAELQERNDSFVSSQCRYEIVDDRVVEFHTLCAVDNSPIAKLKDVETLFLRRDPRLKVPANLTFVAGLKNLSVLNVDGVQLHDLQPLKSLKLKSLCMWLWNRGGSNDGDLSPLQGMPIRELNCGGSRLIDLSPLKGAPIEIMCANSTQISDLSPLKGMPMRDLMIENTAVDDLTALKGMPLWRLVIARTKVRDLAPIKGMPLQFLNIAGLQIDDLSVLRQLPLKVLWMDYDPAKNDSLLRQLPHLEQLNGRPIAEFDFGESP